MQKISCLEGEILFSRSSLLQESDDPKNRLVSDLVAAEATYINTGHPDFIGGHKAMPLVNAKIEAAKAAPLTGPLTLDILKGQGASMMDPPPQTLEAAGVLSEHKVIETDVILYRPDVLDDLMNKSKIVVNWRKECTNDRGSWKANEQPR
ncbi:hypothetical protein H4Q26_013407 [Puccinia striiformis f. sp. tritici PST-130]|nr:hypothetical protein H4Q26_013407 [Puccinia striiformis f. sp. tritici PST-130]